MSKLTLSTLLVLSSLILVGQGNSPYSQLGIGSPSSSTFQANFSMGGVASTYKSETFLNPKNPASYSKLKYVVGEIGVFNSNNFYSNGSSSGTENTFNLGNFGFGIPLGNDAGLAIGIMPYTRSKYSYQTNDVTSDNTSIIRKFRGQGNVNQFFIGTGYSIKNLSFGINIKHLFGEITNAELLEFLTADFKNIRVQTINEIRGWDITLAANYEIEVDEEHKLTLGLTIDKGLNIGDKIKSSNLQYQLINNYDLLETTTTDGNVIIEDHLGGTELSNTEDNKVKSEIILPHAYRAGITYSKEKSFFLGLDYENTAWDVFRFNGSNSGFKRAQKVFLGGELIPNSEAKGSENYWKSIRYSGGINYGSSPISIAGQQLKEYGINIGFGFPLRKYKYESEKFGSYVFASFGYDKVSSNSAGGISEDYFKISFAIILNDKWFVKKKYD